MYRDIEMPTSRVLRKMERNGVLIDGELLRVQSGQIATPVTPRMIPSGKKTR